MDKSESVASEFAGKAVPITWVVPDDIPTQHVTNLVVQHNENEFIVSFFEMRDPVILGSPEAVRERVEQLESVTARCVARIVVAPGRMSAFVQVLQDNLEKFRNRMEETDERK